jgi:hypothetical protein
MRNNDGHLVPVLGAGSHVDPRKGGCLLELVSTLPAGRGPRTRAADPVLGLLAWAVNDRTSPAQRSALAGSLHHGRMRIDTGDADERSTLAPWCVLEAGSGQRVGVPCR